MNSRRNARDSERDSVSDRCRPIVPAGEPKRYPFAIRFATLIAASNPRFSFTALTLNF